ATSLVIMPFLSWAQRRIGKALGSNAVVADSTQTLLCTYLSAVLLVGLVLNATLGWSWADPIAGLVIAGVAVKEAARPGAVKAAAPPSQAAPVTAPRLDVAVPTAAPRTGAARSMRARWRLVDSSSASSPCSRTATAAARMRVSRAAEPGTSRRAPVPGSPGRCGGCARGCEVAGMR